MTATPALTTDLRRQVLALEDDLRARVESDEKLTRDWRAEHAEAVTKERTAASWTLWRDDRVTQAAVAWVLGTVFVRFCEDNALVAPVCIAGPQTRRQEALDAQTAYFRQHPEDTDREWLRQGIDHLAGLRATAALFDRHSAIHWVSPSGNAATVLLDFWRRRGDDGALVHDLSDPELSTRFLGDLYQELSQHAKDTYALLQTPEFVEEFILDRTLEPALAERPLDGFRMIDPTCGSGHFLLGAFARLLDRWHRQAPAMEIQARVQQALDAIHGVDLNPFAVAIARFRLTVAALEACGLRSLEAAPAFTLHLAVGDSLIHGPDVDTLPGLGDRTAFMDFTYATEDGPLLLTLLEEGSYDVVVGNPPYKAPPDKAVNGLYRSKYGKICRGGYSMTVPFMAQFFALARSGDQCGWVGQITASSFMKREFGAPLIEGFLTRKDLRLVVDTSGAFIPGHTTPTVIIVGRNQASFGPALRAVLGIRSEPSQPSDPTKGIIWRSIAEHVDKPGWSDNWITVTDLPRDRLRSHPWSLSGGGASDLRVRLDSSSGRLASRLQRSGMFGDSHAEDLFAVGHGVCERLGIDGSDNVAAISGDYVRDWDVAVAGRLILPSGPVNKPTPAGGTLRALWPWKTSLWARATFASGSYREAGRHWLSWHQISVRDHDAMHITFAKIATHNHFGMGRQGGIEKPSALRLELPSLAAVEQYRELLGILNSSTACFWLKENSQSKGGQSGTGGFMTELWEQFYEFTGTTLQDYPLPAVLPLRRGSEVDRLAADLATQAPAAVCAVQAPSTDLLTQARKTSEGIRARMIAQQEELDWEVYRLYGLVGADLTYGGDDLPGLALGERAFEIVMARAVANGEEETAWFARHGSTPITKVPAHWPAAYQELVQQRLDLIGSDSSIRLLEKPEYKRRWAQEPWGKRQERAVREWLLDRLEDRRSWFDAQGRPQPQSVAQLADDVARDADLVSVLALWAGRPDVPVTQSLVRLLADEAVPYLAAYRCKDSGLRKRAEWEETWSLQRREDAGERVGTFQPPPKYTSADFRKNSYWQARGKLDVPKERFILYPDAGRETDPTSLLGWAGWNHAQQSLALSLIIGAREADGWDDARLVPLVAGLAEVQPWVQQWHSEVDEIYGVSLAAFCAEQLASRAAQVGWSPSELATWRPAAATRGRRAKTK